MPALPPSSDFTGSTRTNAQMKASHAALRSYLAGSLGEDGTLDTANRTLGTLLQGGIRVRTSATTLVPEDRGKIVNCSGTWTASLPSLATVGERWAIVIRNTGSGTITLAANGSDLIEAAGTVALVPGAAVILISGAFGAWMALMLASGFADGRLLRTADLMTSATDPTTDRILRLVGNTGAFGSGASYAPLIANLDDILTPAGLYFFNMTGGTSGTGPGFHLGAVIVVHAIGSGTRAPQQIAIQRTAAGGGRLAWRTSLGGTWGAWQTAYGTGNALGTVSQSGGQPTGALLQFGSNANGAFERRASGRQECIRTDLSAANVSTAEGQMFRSGDITWTFPSAFATGVKPVVTVTGEAPALCGFAIVSISNTAVTFRVKSATSIASAVTLHASATGRWSTMT